MMNSGGIQKKNKDIDLANRIAQAASEEIDKIGESIGTQVMGETVNESKSPIVEAMEQKTEDMDEEKQADIKKMRNFIERREELENELKVVRKKAEDQEKEWNENINHQLNIVEPGKIINERTPIPLTTKPKRGQMPGMPGTARGETGPEVRKSKQ